MTRSTGFAIFFILGLVIALWVGIPGALLCGALCLYAYALYNFVNKLFAYHA